MRGVFLRAALLDGEMALPSRVHQTFALQYHLSILRLPGRGLVRQLGKPALLAATYKGDVAAIATAAMEELESTLVDSISQLERFSPGSGKDSEPDL